MTETTTSTRVPTFHCPGCLRALDCATSVLEPATPKPGDVSVCFYCATVLEFDDELRIREVTEHTLQQLSHRELATLASLKVLALARAVKAGRSDNNRGNEQ